MRKSNPCSSFRPIEAHWRTPSYSTGVHINGCSLGQGQHTYSNSSKITSFIKYFRSLVFLLRAEKLMILLIKCCCQQQGGARKEKKLSRTRWYLHSQRSLHTSRLRFCKKVAVSISPTHSSLCRRLIYNHSVLLTCDQLQDLAIVVPEVAQQRRSVSTTQRDWHQVV